MLLVVNQRSPELDVVIPGAKLTNAVPKIVLELVLDSVENAIGSPVTTGLG
jgi:hypothetical protein